MSLMIAIALISVEILSFANKVSRSLILSHHVAKGMSFSVNSLKIAIVRFIFTSSNFQVSSAKRCKSFLYSSNIFFKIISDVLNSCAMSAMFHFIFFFKVLSNLFSTFSSESRFFSTTSLFDFSKSCIAFSSSQL